MKTKIKRIAISYIISLCVFTYIYILTLMGGYESARSLCEVNYNFQYVTAITMAPVCFALKSVENDR